VTTDSTRLLKLLERRLDLLGTLTVALQESRNDFVAMDLGGMERRIAEQEQLCARIRSLDSEISSVQAHYAGRAASLDDDMNNGEQIRVMLRRVSAAQLELKRANDAHQAMLRRSRRTVQVLLNVFNSFAPTYSAPASVGSTYEERV